MKTLLCALILATLGTAAAQAATITITLDQPNQVALPGTTVDFFGTITNTTAGTIFLNGDDLNLAGISFSTTDQPFFDNAPFFLAPGANSGDIELFEVSVASPLLDTAGFYAGSFDIKGGIDGNAQDVLGSTSFSVNTASTAPSAVPEPATLTLLLTGASTLLPIAKKLRKRTQI